MIVIMIAVFRTIQIAIVLFVRYHTLAFHPRHLHCFYQVLLPSMAVAAEKSAEKSARAVTVAFAAAAAAAAINQQLLLPLLALDKGQQTRNNNGQTSVEERQLCQSKQSADNLQKRVQWTTSYTFCGNSHNDASFNFFAPCPDVRVSLLPQC